MLYVCTNITEFHSFFELFQKTNAHLRHIDMSTVSPNTLADEADAIVQHHKDCCIFLGYIEPGWMLESPHQTRLRTLFRKFPVGIVLQYVDSLPHSWKNEIDIVYTFGGVNNYGESISVNNGSAIHNKS